jgi:hypothetical protein
VNAAHFWHLLNLGAYRGQEEDLPQLVGKLKIRARRWDQRIQQIQQISVPCGEHCVLTGDDSDLGYGPCMGHTLRNNACLDCLGCSFHRFWSKLMLKPAFLLSISQVLWTKSTFSVGPILFFAAEIIVISLRFGTTGGAPNQAEEALLAVGCQLALDPVPAAFAGSTPWHVAKHVEWLRMNDLLQVEAALDEHKERPFVRCQRWIKVDKGGTCLLMMCLKN